MKKILCINLFSLALFATDYSTMSLDELLQQRGTVDAIDKEVYQAEMQSRMQTLTPEERSAIPRGQGNGSGNGQRKMLKDGTGGGNMYKGSRGHGGGGR